MHAHIPTVERLALIDSPFRPIFLALAIIAISLLASCTPEDPFVPTRPVDTTQVRDGAFLRVIHAASDGPAVDVLIDGVRMFSGAQGFLDFKENTSAGRNNNARYYPVDSASRRIVFSSGGATIAEDTLSLKKGEFYTAYLHGSSEIGYRVLVTSDSIHSPTDPVMTTKYRVVNLSPDSPPIDIKQNDTLGAPVITNLAYGTASQYVPTKPYFPTGTGIWIYDHSTGKEIRAITPPYIVLPPGSTFTLVLTGNSFPTGNEAFLFFSVFQEDSRGSDSLYGAVPFNITFAALRFANLVPTGEFDLLDVTIHDPNNEFCTNDNFRRNLVGQPQTVESVASLGLEGQRKDRPYFFVSLLVRQEFPYRIEYHQPDRVGINCAKPANPPHKDYRKQDVLVGRNEFKPDANRRYTVVAYGPYHPDSARAAVILDNTPQPPAGRAQVRFFHGGFAPDAQNKKLRLRINGQMTPSAMTYGKVPEGSNSFASDVGDVTIEVIDEGGSKIYEQKMENTPLEANKSYTIFLTRGPFGNTLYLHALAEEITQ